MNDDIRKALENVGLRLDQKENGYAFVWTTTGDRGDGFATEAEALERAVRVRLANTNVGNLAEPVQDYEGIVAKLGHWTAIGHRVLVSGDKGEIRMNGEWIPGIISVDKQNGSLFRFTTANNDEVGVVLGTVMRLRADLQL